MKTVHGALVAGTSAPSDYGFLALAFPDAAQSTIQLVLTLPPLIVIPFVMLSGKMCRVFGKKKVLLAGLTLYLIGGLGAGFTNTISSLLLCRAVLGLSVGLIMPISAIVGDFFKGYQATRMMGWVSAANNFGGMLSQILAGFLATMCWRYSFGAYGLAFVSFVMVYLFLPGLPETKTINAVKSKMPRPIYLYAGAMFILMVMFYTVPVHLSFFIEKNGLGTATASGIAFALMTGAGFIVGTCFHRIRTAFKQYAVTIAVGCMAAGFGVIYNAHGIILVCCGVILV